MNKEKEILSIIELCRNIEIDGETTEYVLRAIGMEDQMLRQLVLNADWDKLNYLIEEKRDIEYSELMEHQYWMDKQEDLMEG
jgi:hypothetical protein